MSWYVHPSKQLRDDELPLELVVTNRNGSMEQVYTPHRTAERVRVPYRGHVALGHHECGECHGTVGPQDSYCRSCGARLGDE